MAQDLKIKSIFHRFVGLPFGLTRMRIWSKFCRTAEFERKKRRNIWENETEREQENEGDEHLNRLNNGMNQQWTGNYAFLTVARSQRIYFMFTARRNSIARRNSKLHASLQKSSSYSLKYYPISKRFKRLKWLNASAQIKDIDDNECWSERIYIILLCVFLAGGYI